jgi:ABC-type glycerol-3-phosphate transport system permease component
MMAASIELLEYWDDIGVRFPPQSVKAVMVLATIGPIILIYPFVQKHFIRGIMIGSLKG